VEGKVSLREKIILGILVLLLLTGGIWRAAQFKPAPPEVVRESFSEEETVKNEPELITVHLVGAVNYPGVYHLPAGSRVYELLDLCGGFAPEADRESLNQARPLLDGEQIHIKQAGEAPASSSESSSSAKININQASASELTALPGIGEVRAGQIVDHREKNGYFKDPRELMDVSGIGDKTFDSIKDLVTVY
jgi:competence protein ComEA